ncbi:CHASE domain-containing protein [Psychromonas sp. B3M02]|uniref:CHASE domain-containing protein n=1 Tax=Psychromonas sp. B3M02 TaxID=2267226 RepID=UPI00215DA812|nr:CHASE domain-containing protein [Psychromonas sp. B3M02]
MSIKSFVVAVVVSLIGVLSTYSVSLKVANQLKSENSLKIENTAKQVSIYLQDSIDKSLNELRGLQAFYSVEREELSQVEFNRYMDILDIKSRNYIQALSWVPLIKADEKEEYLARLRREHPTFNIVKRDENNQLIISPDKDEYTPVTYFSSIQLNKKALGFDLSSNDTRRKTLELARNSGKMATTGKINLVQQAKNLTGALIIAPVYNKGLATDSVAERINALRGYVTGVFKINVLMENAERYADMKGLQLTLLDIEENKIDLLYGSDITANTLSFDLAVPERQWQLHVTLNTALLESIESPSVIKWILAGGIVISLLLGIAIYSLLVSIVRAKNISLLSEELQTQNSRLEEKVDQRTQSLADKNSQLKENVEVLEKQRGLLSRLMTEAEQAKMEAQSRAVELSRSNKELDEFAYVASHDLKAPLRGIDQLATWVIEDIEEGELEEIPEHLKMMRSRIGRLESLLNDLLEYSQVNHRSDSLSMIDSKVVINELFVLVSPLNSFTLICDGEMPVFSSFRAPFEQVVRNLLSNAIKHHHQKQGTINVRCEDLGEFYQFSVEDDGPGISKKYQEEIFKMFKTLKPRDETEGSGMGLALIKKIVEYYNGEVNIQSQEGEGCTFYFTWPKQVIDK